MATIKDVAAKAGVSITTVSFVLNGKTERISLETQERVKKACKDLNYRANILAQSMITKKSGIIGVIIPQIDNPFFASMIENLNAAAEEKGYSIIFNEYRDKEEKLFKSVDLFISYQVEGVILAKSSRLASNKELEVVNMFKNSNVPCVTVDSSLPLGQFPSVQIDHRYGGYLATTYLLENGHKNIAAITGPKDSQSSQERLDGYEKAMKEHGNLDNQKVISSAYGFNDKVDILEALLKERYTAVFAFNDMIAISLLYEANKKGIKIPDEISIIGFDNIYLTEIVHPQLSTIHQPLDQLAGNSLSVLIRIIEAEETQEVENIVLKPSIVLRDTVKTI